jgi:nucleolin
MGPGINCLFVCRPVRLLACYRPLKMYYCPPRPGDKWPPHPIGSNMSNPNLDPASSSTHTLKAAGGSSSNQPPRREKTEKPPGCKKLFAGNLSYNIDDETIVDFFKECGALVGLRWLTRKETEEFRVRTCITSSICM